jgi:hypothetical protein
MPGGRTDRPHADLLALQLLQGKIGTVSHHHDHREIVGARQPALLR